MTETILSNKTDSPTIPTSIPNKTDNLTIHTSTNSCFIDNLYMTNKNVLLRVDYNVPVQNGVITSDHRITESIATITKILKSGAKRLIIASHMGRPNGKNPDLSLSVVVPVLEKILDKKVCFLPDGLSNKTLDILNKQTSHIYLLENLRYHREETSIKLMKKDSQAYTVLQQLGDVYINDAFGCLHRPHMSISHVKYNTKGYGYLVQKELNALQLITKKQNKQKTLAIIGGGKMDDKLKLIKELSKKVDTIFIGGGNINSFIENDMTDYYNEITSNKANIVIAEDGAFTSDMNNPPDKIYVTETNIVRNGKYSHLDCKVLLKRDERPNFPKDNGKFYDIFNKSLATLKQLVEEHSIIFWNGTMGLVEKTQYAYGSLSLLTYMENAAKKDPSKKIIIGGGDTAGFVKNAPKDLQNIKLDFISHISTGGGAAIEYIIDDTLVGLDQFT